MKPKTTEEPQDRLFQNRLENMINMDHELVRLGDKINWKAFESKLGEVYIANKGRPGLPTRLMVGLHYLKGLHDLSDEAVVQGFLENPYWQYFCGMEYFMTELPLDPSSMTRWRKRTGPKGFEAMLKESIETAMRTKCLKPKDLECVIVDTTVQANDITFPTDLKLYAKGIELLVRESKREGVRLRRTYVRTVPSLQRASWQFARSRKFKKAAACTKKVKTILGRLIREITAKQLNRQADTPISQVLEMAQRVFEQKRKDTNKLYSYFEPETACIAKGKSDKKYEFGSKASIASTHRNNFIVGAQTYGGCPNDVTTLKSALTQISEITGVFPKEAYCDKGYRGKARHKEIPCAIHIPGMQGEASISLKKKLKRRNAIEPIIGHLKRDYGMDRNYLKGRVGDEINALMASCAYNLKKILNHLRAFIQNFLKGKIPAFWDIDAGILKCNADF